MAAIVRSGAGKQVFTVTGAIAVPRSIVSVRMASHAVVLLAVWMMAMVVATPRAFAASYTWTNGSGDGLWSTGSNWTPVFTNGQPLELTFDAVSGTSINDLAAGTTLQSLTFTASAGASFLDNTDNTDFSLNALTVASGGIVRNLSADEQRIRFRLQVDNNLELNAAGAGTLVVESLDGGAGITKTGAGVLSLVSNGGITGNYSGNISLTAGTTLFDYEANFASSSVTLAAGATMEVYSYLETVVSAGVLNPGTRFGDPTGPLLYSMRSSDLTMQGTNETNFSIANHGNPVIGEQQNYIELTSPTGTASLVYGGVVAINFENSNTYAIGTTWDLIKTDATTVADRTGTLAGIATTGLGPYAGLTFTVLSAGTGSGDAVWRSGWAGSTDTMLEFREASGQLVVVPEPSTMVFAGMGAALSGWSMWRRRRATERAAARARAKLAA